MAAIIVENGSGVPNANSYVDAAEITAFLELMGVDAGEITPEQLAITSAMFIAVSVKCWPGCRTTDTQGMDWPRKGVWLSCSDRPYPSNKIPDQLKRAQLFAALAAAQGIVLFPAYDPTAGNIKREELGPLKTEFFGQNMNVYGTLPTLPAVQSLLDELTARGCGGHFRVVRV